MALDRWNDDRLDDLNRTVGELKPLVPAVAAFRSQLDGMGSKMDDLSDSLDRAREDREKARTDRKNAIVGAIVASLATGVVTFIVALATGAIS